MNKITELFKTKKIIIKEIKSDNGETYTYVSDIWSESVAILPYKMKFNFLDVKVPEFLGKYDVHPPHSQERELYSITGSVEDNKSPVFTARKILLEKGGYDIPCEKFIYLGTVNPSKLSDKVVHLFSVDVDGFKREDVVDKNGGYCEVVSVEGLSNSKDPLLHAMFIKSIGEGLFN